MHHFLAELGKGLLFTWLVTTCFLGHAILVCAFLDEVWPKIEIWLCAHNIHWKKRIVKWNKRCRWCLTDWILNSEDEWEEQ